MANQEKWNPGMESDSELQPKYDSDFGKRSGRRGEARIRRAWAFDSAKITMTVRSIQTVYARLLRSSRRKIFPDAVFGIVSTKRICRGCL